MHTRAWEAVGEYLQANLRILVGKPSDAESTVLPSLTSWLQETIADTPECRVFDDHGIILWVNLPSAGILSAHKYDFLITTISNVLAMHRKNSMAILVHPNRASDTQQSRPGARFVTLMEPSGVKILLGSHVTANRDL